MLPARNRMRRGADFSAAVRHGARGSSRRLVVHLSPAADAGDSDSLVGFVVSRAVGPAVTRNRVRRRLRHLMRDRLAGLPAGARAVVRALPAAAAATSGDLAADLDAALRTARRRTAGTAR